jgi:hypothetical protein
MTETQQRFLRAIAARVPMEQVVELHLFPPIRQGGVETGVAIVAEDPRPPVTASAPGDVESEESTEATIEVPNERDPSEREQSVELDDVADALPAIADDASPYAEDIQSDDEDRDDDDDDDDDDDEVADNQENENDEDDNDVLIGARASAARVAARFTIHTARYRLTLKGVDRGKWEVDVVAEADAPLDAVDAVIRGVQRRSGEGAEPERLSTEALREALEAPLATLER